MKYSYISLLLFIPFVTFSQSYQCLLPGVTQFFTNSDGYLRGIRIDSVKTYPDSSIYFPYHSPRGRYYNKTTCILDTSMGSWLGKNVIRRSDGSFLFDNIWNDTIVIKTQAHTGDSWILYNDTTKLYYQADIVAEDTMTFSGMVDSVKKILITARNLAGIVISDPVNGFELVLSKNNGFVSAIDLYTFPYHSPDSNYLSGLDYFLDLVTSSDGKPTTGNSIFTRSPFNWPTCTQLYNWNVGDVYETKYCLSESDLYTCSFPAQLYFDSVTSKTVFPDSVHYTISEWEIYQKFNFDLNPYLYYPYAWTTSDRSFTIPNTSFFNTTLLPEELRQGNIFYYFPADTSFCAQSEKYYTFPNEIDPAGRLSIPIEGGGPVNTYKKDLNMVAQYSIGTSHLSEEIISNSIVYYTHNGITCGSFIAPSFLAVSEINDQPETIELFPNPATDEITLKSALKIRDVTITNIIGQSVYIGEHNSSKVRIEVSGLPKGLYFVKVNGTDIKKFIRE